MKTSLGLFLLVLFLSGTCAAQLPDTVWTHTYGGDGEDYFWSINLTSDGGFVGAGLTGSRSLGGLDAYLVKTDAEGIHIWTNTFGGTAFDMASAMHPLPDGGSILIGNTQSIGPGGWFCMAIRTDFEGNQLWMQTYGSGGNFHDGKPTTDGGFIFVGIWAGDLYLVKTDSAGGIQWEHTYGGEFNERGRAVVQTEDGGYAATGNTESFEHPEKNVFLVRVDSAGNELWSQNYGGDLFDEGWDLVNTGDGGFLIGAHTYSFGAGDQDLYLIRTNSLGDTLWTQTYGTTGNDYLGCVKNAADGGFLIAGDQPDSNFINKDPLILKLDVNGALVWSMTVPLFGDNSAHDLIELENGDLIAGGQTNQQNSNGWDALLIRLSSDTSVIEPTGERIPDGNLPANFTILSAYPNPFNAATTISFTLPNAGKVKMAVYDVLGRMVGDHVGSPLPAGEHHIPFDGSGLASGIYFVRLEAGSYQAEQKIVLLK